MHSPCPLDASARAALREPLRFQPFLRPMVWGGRALARALGRPLPAGGAYGESWEVSDHPLHRSTLARGPLRGATLRDLMADDAEALLGPAAARHAAFPWLVKVLDAEGWLSVQVHPDEAAVQALLPGECAKTEAWFVLDARPGSLVYAGLKPGVRPEDLRAALQAGAVADCLHRFAPRRGDVVFLPAGTVHAVGGGVLFAEVQQTSDATFRLYDWGRRDGDGRPRPLHVEEACASIDWARGPVRPVNAVERARAARPGARVPLLSCPYFRWEYLAADRAVELGGAGCLQAVIVTGGAGALADGSRLGPGEVLVLPAGMPAVTLRVEENVALLLCSLAPAA